MTAFPLPIPLFDTLEHLEDKRLFSHAIVSFSKKEIKCVYDFLKQYDKSPATFRTYRREIERLLQWSEWICKKSVIQLQREDIEAYLKFCKNPPLRWIGLNKVPRFIEQEGKRIPNSAWKPFVATISKTATRQGKKVKKEDYFLSDKAFQSLLAVLSTFYSFLLREEYIKSNPITKIRQKNQYIARESGPEKIRRLTELQWDFVIKTAESLAKKEPALHERTLFIMSALYLMYLRVSELTARQGRVPKMSDFWEDESTRQWWFFVKGKGNKKRDIAVSLSMLEALQRWRLYLKLPALPSLDEDLPLLPKMRTKGGITGTNQIRRIVQVCFDSAIEKMEQSSLKKESTRLKSATAHWLRHTGISEDVKNRPREHVRDDAGHSSSATTDKYINVEMEERHKTANKKLIKKKKLREGVNSNVEN